MSVPVMPQLSVTAPRPISQSRQTTRPTSYPARELTLRTTSQHEPGDQFTPRLRTASIQPTIAAGRGPTAAISVAKVSTTCTTLDDRHDALLAHPEGDRFDDRVDASSSRVRGRGLAVITRHFEIRHETACLIRTLRP